MPTESNTITGLEANTAAMTTPASADGAASSPLLNKLPPKIRNQIWRLVLLHPKTLHIRRIVVMPGLTDRHTGLLGACHQTREEESSIFYGENTFVMIHYI